MSIAAWVTAVVGGLASVFGLVKLATWIGTTPPAQTDAKIDAEEQAKQDAAEKSGRPQ